MNANRRRHLMYLFLAVAVALNVGIMVWRTQSESRIPTGARQVLIDEQTDRLANWASKSTIPTASVSEWIDEIKSAASEGCLDVPEQVTLVATAEVPRVERDSFHDAVAGLLRVYVENSPELMIQYMAEHDERPSSQRAESIKKVLGDVRKVPVATVQSLTPEEVYVSIWKAAGTNAHWSAILEGSGCHQFWRYNELPDAALQQSFGTSEGLVFQNITKMTSNFEPVRPLDAVLQSDGSVLYADVKVVIQLDAEFYNEAVPYFFRFWYDSAGGVWHPYQMGQVKTTKGNGPRLLF